METLFSQELIIYTALKYINCDHVHKKKVIHPSPPKKKKKKLELMTAHDHDVFLKSFELEAILKVSNYQFKVRLGYLKF